MSEGSKNQRINLKKAFLDPASEFSSPRELLHEVNLTKEQKIEILRRWEYDACEESVAADEGMGEVDGVLLQQIVLTLQILTGGLNQDRSPPTKQGGLDRSSLKTKR